MFRRAVAPTPAAMPAPSVPVAPDMPQQQQQDNDFQIVDRKLSYDNAPDVPAPPSQPDLSVTTDSNVMMQDDLTMLEPTPAQDGPTMAAMVSPLGAADNMMDPPPLKRARNSDLLFHDQVDQQDFQDNDMMDDAHSEAALSFLASDVDLDEADGLLQQQQSPPSPARHTVHVETVLSMDDNDDDDDEEVVLEHGFDLPAVVTVHEPVSTAVPAVVAIAEVPAVPEPPHALEPRAEHDEAPVVVAAAPAERHGLLLRRHGGRNLRRLCLRIAQPCLVALAMVSVPASLWYRSYREATYYEPKEVFDATTHLRKTIVEQEAIVAAVMEQVETDEIDVLEMKRRLVEEILMGHLVSKKIDGSWETNVEQVVIPEGIVAEEAPTPSIKATSDTTKTEPHAASKMSTIIEELFRDAPMSSMVHEDGPNVPPARMDVMLAKETVPVPFGGMSRMEALPLASRNQMHMFRIPVSGLLLLLAAFPWLYKALLCRKEPAATIATPRERGDLTKLVVHWQTSLQRQGRRCRAGKAKPLPFDTMNYEILTKEDLEQVLLEGFNYKAASKSSKLELMYTVCDKYGSALKSMEPKGIRNLLKMKGVHVPVDMKKDKLILLALDTGF